MSLLFGQRGRPKPHRPPSPPQPSAATPHAPPAQATQPAPAQRGPTACDARTPAPAASPPQPSAASSGFTLNAACQKLLHTSHHSGAILVSQRWPRFTSSKGAARQRTPAMAAAPLAAGMQSALAAASPPSFGHLSLWQQPSLDSRPRLRPALIIPAQRGHTACAARSPLPLGCWRASFGRFIPSRAARAGCIPLWPVPTTQLRAAGRGLAPGAALALPQPPPKSQAMQRGARPQPAAAAFHGRRGLRPLRA